MPEVSIIIPVYNKFPYLERCINSLMIMHPLSIEIILIDDGSTDGSATLCDQLAARYSVIRVKHQENQGVSVARNQGLNLARGKWIWFVDSDDVPEPEWLSHIYHLLQMDCFDIICSDFQRYVNGQKAEIISPNHQGMISCKEFPRLFMQAQIDSGYFGYLWCKLLRKSFIEKSGASFSVGLKLAEDLKFLLKLYENSPRLVFTHDIAMNYTVDAINSSNEQAVDYQSQLEIRYDMYKWIKTTDCYGEFETYLQYQISQFTAFVFFYAYERERRINKEIEWFYEHSEFASCLNTEQMIGIMKKIVQLVQQNKMTQLKLLLKTRYNIRSFVRRMRH